MSKAATLPRPDPTIHPVGRNQSRVPGQMQLALLRHCGLMPSSALLEIGCGIGRLAYELADFVEDGSYVGFDISVKAIEWLNEHYAPVLPGFAFRLVDASNARYRPQAAHAAADAEFPAETGAFDMVCAFSIFTHMRAADIERYLAETRRVLAPGGRGVLTFFSIREDEQDPRLDEQGRFVELDDGTWTTDPDQPERAIGYAEATIRRMCQAAGLVIHELRPGFWRDKSLKRTVDPPLHKDVFVVGRG